jgi:hypothetical protein
MLISRSVYTRCSLQTDRVKSKRQLKTTAVSIRRLPQHRTKFLFVCDFIKRFFGNVWHREVMIKGKVVPVFNLAPYHEDVLGSGGIPSRILDLGTWWRWMVSFTPRPLYLQRKSHWHRLDRRLGGTQYRSGRGGEEKNSHPLRESNPRIPIIQPVAQRFSDWAITALKWW